ncbi:MAG: anhydro-N-acetylmuramic acid kinase [Planctomycetota bacterium]
MPASRYVLGAMTGTSLDGLDVALVRVDGVGLDMTAEYLGLVSRPLGELAEELRSFAAGEAHPALTFSLTSRTLGQAYADACVECVEKFLPEGRSLDLIVAHGQTIWHAPEDGVSWQLFDPMPCCRALRATVCFNLRQADLVAGGEGAPITPIADWVMFRHPDKHRLVVNLGGIANVTSLPPDRPIEQITGGDIGPCNILIDGIVQRLVKGKMYDEDGAIARTGTPTGCVVDVLEKHPALFGEGHHSLGREDFPEQWIDRLVSELRRQVAPADLIASAIEGVATLVASVAAPEADELILAGGGARNPVLVERIAALSPFESVVSSDAVGMPCEAREAAGFAVLGALSQDGVPITLSRITGAQRPGRAGMWVFP